MRQAAIAQILSTADATGNPFTLDIFLTAYDGGYFGAKLIRFHWIQQENLLEVATRDGQRVYIDGDHIETIKVTP